MFEVKAKVIDVAMIMFVLSISGGILLLLAVPLHYYYYYYYMLSLKLSQAFCDEHHQRELFFQSISAILAAPTAHRHFHCQNHECCSFLNAVVMGMSWL